MSQTENDLYKQALAVYLNSEKDTRPYWETDHRGMVMPLVKSGYNNSVSYGVPGILGGSAWGTLNDIIEGRQVAKGEIEQAAGDAAGAAMTGSFALSRPTGSIGSGGRVANDLPMDQASRLARAKEMGFDTDTVFYRGGQEPISEFDGGKLGAFFSDSPAVGSSYAMSGDPNVTGKHVMPVYIRRGNQKTVDANGRQAVQDYDIWTEAYNAKNSGADSLLVTNVDDSNGAGVLSNVIASFDPRNIRSVNAAFDPAMAGSANLLAANAPTSAAAPSLQHIIDALMRRDDQSRQ